MRLSSRCLPLAGQLETALARITALETRLAHYERPPKGPANSSVPPSKGHKPNRPGGDPRLRKSRFSIGRMLDQNPDRVVDAMLECVFRLMPAGDFDANQPVIPTEANH